MFHDDAAFEGELIDDEILLFDFWPFLLIKSSGPPDNVGILGGVNNLEFFMLQVLIDKGIIRVDFEFFLVKFDVAGSLHLI